MSGLSEGTYHCQYDEVIVQTQAAEFHPDEETRCHECRGQCGEGCNNGDYRCCGTSTRVARVCFSRHLVSRLFLSFQ